MTTRRQRSSLAGRKARPSRSARHRNTSPSRWCTTLTERQVRRALAALQHPIPGLMPEGRDTLHPTVARLFKAFADYSLVQVKDARGRVVETRFARLNSVQAHILQVMELRQPAELFAQPM